MSLNETTEEFQKELFAFVERVMFVDGIRFHVYMPRIDLNMEVTTDEEVNEMTQDYRAKYWFLDPMHPTNFEDTDVKVISNSMLMSDRQWMNSKFFKEFFAPHNMFHNVDMFFRRTNRIVAVLTMIRKEQSAPFTDREVKRLEMIQPFVEFALNKVYLPRRIHDRSTLGKEFELTPRELDVVELALTGASNKILVDQLKVSLPTLRTHLQNIYTKVGVHSNAELISRLMTILK